MYIKELDNKMEKHEGQKGLLFVGRVYLISISKAQELAHIMS